MIFEKLTNDGNTLFGGKEFEKAIQKYKTALRIEPNSAETHGNLGAAYASNGKFDEAISEFKEALNINPDLDIIRKHLEMAKEYKRKG